MDIQTIINITVGIAAFFGGWTINRLTQAIDRLDDDMRKIPIYYVSKDDFRRDIDEMKGLLKSIFDKLDHKQDKP